MMGDFSVKYSSDPDPSKRRLRRAVKIALLFALGLTCFTVCFAVTVVIVAVTSGLPDLGEFMGIAIAAMVFLAVAISLLVQMAFVEIILLAMWWLNNLDLSW
jgi:hypothetical protein